MHNKQQDSCVTQKVHCSYPAWALHCRNININAVHSCRCPDPQPEPDLNLTCSLGALKRCLAADMPRSTYTTAARLCLEASHATQLNTTQRPRSSSATETPRAAGTSRTAAKSSSVVADSRFLGQMSWTPACISHRTRRWRCSARLLGLPLRLCRNHTVFNQLQTS